MTTLNEHNTLINTNQSAIQALEARGTDPVDKDAIDANTTQIAINTNNITLNANNITALTGEIDAKLFGKFEEDGSFTNGHEQRITANETTIASQGTTTALTLGDHGQRIATNENDIAVLQTSGVQGEKGDTGEQGIQGIQGEKGDKGDQGIQGIQGLKGDKGDQGPQGLQGLQGPQGQNAIMPEVAVSDTSYNAMELQQKSSILRDIQNIFRNELLASRRTENLLS